MAASTVVGYVTDDQMPSEFVSALLSLLAQRTDDIKNRVINVQGFAGRLDIGRHIIADTFMQQTDGEYLLMLDTDTIFDIKDYDRLLQGAQAADGPTVQSGIYARADGTIAVWDWTTDGLAPTHPSSLTLHRYYRAGSVGLGFCLIHREVLGVLAKEFDGPLPWFDAGEPGDGYTRMADDSSFCWRLKAHDIPLWVDAKVLVGHLKRVTMMPKLPPVQELVVPEKKELILP